jgi:hypothetical protein
MQLNIFPRTPPHCRVTTIRRPGRLRRRVGRRSGFSFAEVMFAVVILGIGFILISAIFPIAAEQSLATGDEAVAAQLAKSAIDTIRSETTSDDFPDSLGAMRPFSDDIGLWSKVSSSIIDSNDHRYACIPFYCRNGRDAPLVQITILIVRRCIHDSYTSDDLLGALQPRAVSITSITPAGDGTLTACIFRDQGNSPNEPPMYQSVADGCFLVMLSSDAAGRTFRVGHLVAQDAESEFYSLVPGSGAGADGSIPSMTSAAIVGRDYADVANPGAGYAGPSQDIAVYTTLMSPK